MLSYGAPKLPAGPGGLATEVIAVDSKVIEELARKLAANVPSSVRAMQADLERNFEALLQATFEKLDLVTREEFEIQRKVLERTRDKLARLEDEIKAMEERSRSSTQQRPCAWPRFSRAPRSGSPLPKWPSKSTSPADCRR
jgi:ubiquinone biosynthesis accessory factor UbiK